MSNEILKFCETDTGTNLLTQAEYNSDVQRPIGNQPGIARDKFVNKVLRQTSFMSKVFADYLIQQVGGDVLDNGDDMALLSKITNVFATGVPTGAIIDMTVPQVPTGFLKCNGAAISRTTYSSLFAKLVTAQSYTLQTFTVTVASPAVVTKAGHGFTGGERLRLSSTGTLPTGLDTNTDYFVFFLDANNFRLQTMSNVLAGTFVNTSGAQSGTHSYLCSLWGLGDGSTTFNVPDLRGVFRRSWDDSRGIDPNRSIATLQRDAFQGHWHGSRGGGLVTNTWGDTNGNGNVSVNYAWTSVGSPISDGVNGSPRTANETRPVNTSLMPVIKF